MDYISENYDPGNLLDKLIEKLGTKNDAGLCRKLGVSPSVISRIRKRRYMVGAALLITMHEESGLSIKELRLLMGDKPRSGESARPSSGQAPRPRKKNKTFPTWTAGLEMQIANVLLWKGFQSKSDVLAAVERGERIDRIGTTRIASLRSWLDAK